MLMTSTSVRDYSSSLTSFNMKKKIHVNQHIIRSNGKTGSREPVITVKTYKSNTYCSEVYIDGPCRVIYSPDKPLPCGAKVWIETDEKVTCVTENNLKEKSI